MTTINSDDINRRVQAIARKIDKTQRAATFKPALEQAGELIRQEMTEAPAQGDAFSKHATPAQRRAYWAKVRSGDAQERPGGGYRRSGSAKRWAIKLSRNKVEVGNNAPHAVYLWGDRRPKWVKVQGWPDADEVLGDEANTIVGFFEDALEKALRDDT